MSNEQDLEVESVLGSEPVEVLGVCVHDVFMGAGVWMNCSF